MRTLGSSFLALLLQAQGEGTPDTSALGLLDLVVSTTVVGKAVLLILSLLSIISWAIILYKWVTFRSFKSPVANLSRRVPPQQQIL